LLPLTLWGGLLLLQALLLILFFYWKIHWGQSSQRIERDIHSMGIWVAKHKVDLFCSSILVVLVILCFYPVILKIGYSAGSDFYDHAREAQRIVETKKIDTSYFLYQMYIIAAHQISPSSDYDILGIIVTLLFYILTGLTLYLLIRWTLRETMIDKPYMRGIISTVLSLSLMLITPITLLTLAEKNLYYGYLGINTYHNPTIIILCPLALMLFMLTINLFESLQHRNKRYALYLMIAAITILSTLAKPNYIICLLPASIIVCTIRLFQKRQFDWIGIAIGIIFPALVLLGWQYLATYTSNHILKDESGISIMPFQLYLIRDDMSSIIYKFILAILFPLIVYILYFQHARKDFALNFAWLCFIIGATYTYILVEQGARYKHNNFGWSGQITLFILFVTSTIFWLRQLFDKTVTHRYNAVTGILSMVFGLHLISGIIWYALHIINPMDTWW
jgi:hypothetical protein